MLEGTGAFYSFVSALSMDSIFCGVFSFLVQRIFLLEDMYKDVFIAWDLALWMCRIVVHGFVLSAEIRKKIFHDPHGISQLLVLP